MYTELTGLDDEQTKTEASGIRRAVEVRGKDSGRETTTTAAQEQGKKVCFIEEERVAQEAREWQEQFMHSRAEVEKIVMDGL